MLSNCLNGKCQILMLLNIMFVLVLVITPTDTLALCDNQPDGPDCPCFDNTGAWNPGGAFIQDVAIQTVGTRESCACPGTAGCDWEIGPDAPFTDAGKPYYQMYLGCNSEAVALFASWALSHVGRIYDSRDAWCSETISYWHREAAIPYPGGYRTCGWHCDWQNHNVAALKTWYRTEEDSGGRGRWIEPEDVDYENFELGLTVPVPGAYVAIRRYDDVNDTWVSNDGAHSLMINEMCVHKDDRGIVFRVEVTLLEGNSSNRVTDTRHWDDILSLTPQGSDWIGGGKKIYGFGIDLNSEGQPIYDPSRLHLVNYQFVASGPPTWPVMATDPVWEQYYDPYIPGLKAYAKLLHQMGEPNVTCSSPKLGISGIPDGQQVYWHFPKGIPGPVEIDIDLLDVHPLPTKGIELGWGAGFFPRDYRVQFASAPNKYQDAFIPDLNKIPLPSPSIKLPAIFTTTGDGVKVRYIKLIFPSAFQEDAILQELRFRYYQGPLADTEECEYELLGDLDSNCRVDFFDVALMAGNWLVDCMVNPDDPACVPQ